MTLRLKRASEQRLLCTILFLKGQQTLLCNQGCARIPSQRFCTVITLLQYDWRSAPSERQNDGVSEMTVSTVQTVEGTVHRNITQLQCARAHFTVLSGTRSTPWQACRATHRRHAAVYSRIVNLNHKTYNGNLSVRLGTFIHATFHAVVRSHQLVDLTQQNSTIVPIIYMELARTIYNIYGV